ncbi:MAG: CDP-diacylglycerol--glycerol-3-phosphate 3-phosphatidyltransferase [Candidatus Omnitrophica bacterium CG11_big_fil_rev_8_21_14_0_20_64_10]|nr:MAG: CDP-diacylglycerol--glycerol-3-phosphate 3-phosphatidyltransferase [Candidatus Omnitrophica bacterium CG11_big_fil_rev_8_21_14_0_20_64_10]
MTLSNGLTLLRVGFAFGIMGAISLPGLPAKVVALILFAAAALSDWLDGKLARKWNQISSFGILMDPIADKVLVLGCFISFVQLQLVPAWMVVLIASREFVVTGLRFFALSRGRVLPAEAAGKHKMVSQMVTISLILIYLTVREAVPVGWGEGWGEEAIWWLTGITVGFTLTSGISFLWKHRRLI